MPGPRIACALAAALALPALGSAAAGTELRNWFGDPFFALSAAVAGCPEPAGPRVSEQERRAQSHRRAEKGTTCWLAQAQDCPQANAYAYDRQIAAAIAADFAQAAELAQSSLWVTVQGRVVYVEGCIARPDVATLLEQRLRQLPWVQQAIALVGPWPARSVPYKTFAPPFAPRSP